MKTLVAVPELITKGGLERVVLAIVKNFNVDIITNKYDPENTFKEFKNVKIIELKKKNKLLFGLKLLFTKFDYDIINGHGYFITNFASVRNSFIWYCHSPKRDLYEPFKNYYLNKHGFLKRKLKSFILNLIKIIDQILVRFFVNRIIVNSKATQKRVKDYYGRESDINYPPVDTKKYRWKNPKHFGNYYLCVSRYDPTKRIEIIIQAFNKMKDKTLIVAGTVRNQKYFEYLKSIANDNIRLHTNIPEEELISLYSKCVSTIYIPINEEFGLTPVEGMASGKPCIGVNEGGLRETIIDEKTGLLINPSVDSVIKAIEWMTPEKATSMRKDCVERAKDFDERVFVKKMSELLD